MQQVLTGISSLEKALEGSRKVLLVCDSSWPYINIGPEIESAIKGIGSPLLKFNDFASNPLYESVCKGVEVFNSSGCDTILAVGGGSSIDVAKCIKLFCRLSPDALYFKQQYADSGIKLIAIPTTAGTGSESTRYAVIYYEGAKQSITHSSIVPDYAILEPSVLESLPVYQKKCTMMDALCQGIESWWSVNATDESRVYSRKAIELIMANWQEYIFSCGGDTVSTAAKAVMLAANYAGRAINITQTTAPHAFSYKLTSLFGLPHGHAVALCLPEIWDFMLDSPSSLPNDPALSFRPSETSGRLSIHAVFTDIAHAMGAETPQDAIAMFRSMMSQLDLSKPRLAISSNTTALSSGASVISTEAEKSPTLLDTLASSVNPIRLANNPIPISQQDARQIYSRILS